MTDAVSPISTSGDRRGGRRSTDPAVQLVRQDAAPAGTNLPAPVSQPPAKDTPAAQFEAQLLGQDGQKRGLRGGPPVLNHAKSAYLGAEWSGKADRRPPKGLFSKTEV